MRIILLLSIMLVGCGSTLASTPPVTFEQAEELRIIAYNELFDADISKTDKELAEAFRNMCQGYTCPHCGKSMYEAK